MSVWLACTEPVTLELLLYDGFGVEPGASGNDVVELVDNVPATAKTYQFGQRIYIGLVTAKTLVPMTHGKIYSYDIKLTKADNKKADLKSEGFLGKADKNGRKQLPIGYKNKALPSFVLSDPRIDKLKIAQASCRKIHGHGFDALAQLDKKIEKDKGATKPEKRPQQLFLTGDQVYADDVPMAVLHHIEMLDDVSIGFREKVKLDETRQSDPWEWAPGLRQGLLYNAARMTSGSASSHVLSFSEYVRLYLMYWSNRAWNKKLYDVIKPLMSDNKRTTLEAAARDFVKPVPSDFTDNESLHAKYKNLRQSGSDLWKEGLTAKQNPEHIGVDIDPMFDVTEDMKKPKEDATAEEHYKFFLREVYLKVLKEFKDTAMFLKDLPNVSRLLANVPSYMIFDDHEVTDDWYLSKRWRMQVFDKGLGCDIIRNGLMAYSIFQDWGNVPDEYIPEKPTTDKPDPVPLPKRTELLRKIIKYGADLAKSEDRPAVADELDTFLGINTLEESQVKWHFDVRTGPTRTFVLDTRTRREFDSLDSPPALLSKEALIDQLPVPHPDGAATKLTFVVSAAPAPGMQSIEQLAQPLYATTYGIRKKTEKNDLTEDDEGLVHGFAGADYEAWGFSVKGLEGLLDRLSNYKSVILFSGDVHYGFSSVVDYWKDKSAPKARILTFTSSSAKNEDEGKWNLFNTAFVQRLMTGIGNNLEKVGWKNRVLAVTGPATMANRLRLRDKTAVVPVNGWIAGSTVNRDPDFRWRFRVLTDKDPHSDDPLSSDVDLSNDASTREAYEKITVRHRDSFISGVHRRMTFRSNVGLLSFETSGSTVSAVHEYLFVAGSRNTSSTTAKSHIKHKVEIVAPTGERSRPVLP